MQRANASYTIPGSGRALDSQLVVVEKWQIVDRRQNGNGFFWVGHSFFGFQNQSRDE